MTEEQIVAKYAIATGKLTRGGNVPTSRKAVYSFVCMKCSEVAFTTTRKVTGFCSKSCHALYFWDSNTDRSNKIDKDGYVKVIAPLNHPIRKNRKSARIAEHVLVMEKMIGRYLVTGENVHHKNGIKADNRPENLELWVRMQPTGQRLEDVLNFVAENYQKEIEAKLEVKNLIQGVIRRLEERGTLSEGELQSL